jgi:hypothetical protein
MLSTNTSSSESNNIKSILLALACMYFMVAPLVALGTVAEWKTNVRAVLSGYQYGSCMVQVTSLPESMNCPRGASNGNAWLSLDCDGNYGSTTSAREALDLANVAMLTGLKVSVRVDDSERNGYCVASQVILWRD